MSRRDDIIGGGHSGCDFCSITKPAASAFPIRPIAGEDTPRPNWWLACGECARLVRPGRREELAHRALNARNEVMGPVSTAVGLASVRELLALIRADHDRFWPARNGNALGLETP